MGNPPPWADELAQIVGRLDGIDDDMDFLKKGSRNSGLGVVHYADGIEDVLDWIENPTTTPALLVPGNTFGPGVMIRNGDVLLIGQFKSSFDAEGESYLAPLHADNWFKQSHRVLRFLGGHPLSSDFDTSVRNGLATLGPDAVVATVNLDTFRAQFITADQATGVLGPLEIALACEGKADR